MLPKRNRLHIGKFFDTLRVEGKRIKGNHFQIIYRQADITSPQVSIIIGKKIAKKATLRNKNRRILLQALKPHFASLPPNLQAFIIPYKDISSVPVQTLTDEISELITRL